MLEKDNSKWLKDFKIAVIENDFDQISNLIKTIPTFSTLEENKEALALVKEANKKAAEQRKLILEQIQKVKKTKKFLEQKEDKYSFDMSF